MTKRRSRPKRSGTTFNTDSIDRLGDRQGMNPTSFDKRADKLQEELAKSDKIIVSNKDERDYTVSTQVKMNLEDQLENLKDENISEYARKKFPDERKFGSGKTKYKLFDVQESTGRFDEEEGPDYTKHFLKDYMNSKYIKTAKTTIKGKTFIATYYPAHFKLSSSNFYGKREDDLDEGNDFDYEDAYMLRS